MEGGLLQDLRPGHPRADHGQEWGQTTLSKFLRGTAEELGCGPARRCDAALLIEDQDGFGCQLRRSRLSWTRWTMRLRFHQT